MSQIKEVQLVPYNALWPAMFEQVAEEIKSALGGACISVEHIGSTSIPGLCAKDIIDVLCIASDLNNSKRLIHAGYVFKGELNIPLRYFYSKREKGLRINLHVVEKDHGFIGLNLCFRDYLRDTPEAADRYGKLKQDLAANPENYVRANGNFGRYTLEKDAIIKALLREARYDGVAINFCTHFSEWEAYHRIKKSEIFDSTAFEYDPNHLSTTSQHDFHFVMYVGVEITAIAHVELMGDGVAALRAIATDPHFRRKGYGSILLTLVEHWLKHQGFGIIKLHADRSAELFFRCFGYVEMLFEDKSILSNPLDMGKIL